MAKRKKRSPRQKATREADKWFSRYIRLRDCLKTTGFSDSGACFTCNRVYPFEKLQCGHFMSRKNMATKYDEENCYAQCYGCNIALSGNYRVFTMKLIERKGIEFVKKLEKRANKTKKYSTAELNELAEEYKKKYERKK